MARGARRISDSARGGLSAIRSRRRARLECRREGLSRWAKKGRLLGVGRRKRLSERFHWIAVKRVVTGAPREISTDGSVKLQATLLEESTLRRCCMGLHDEEV